MRIPGTAFSIAVFSADRLELMFARLVIPVFQRYVSDINVDGIPRKVPVKKIYSSSTMYGEIPYLENKRHHSDKECDLSAVYVIHNHLIL